MSKAEPIASSRRAIHRVWDCWSSEEACPVFLRHKAGSISRNIIFLKYPKISSGSVQAQTGTVHPEDTSNWIPCANTGSQYRALLYFQVLPLCSSKSLQLYVCWLPAFLELWLIILIEFLLHQFEVYIYLRNYAVITMYTPTVTNPHVSHCITIFGQKLIWRIHMSTAKHIQ